MTHRRGVLSQAVTEDGQHGNGWLTVQRLPEELWGPGAAKRVPLRRLALVYSPEEAAPLLQEELRKVEQLATHFPGIAFVTLKP